MGLEAANELLSEINSGASCDKHLADQILPFMALLPGSKITTSQVTNHTKSNAHVIEQFLGKKFHIDGEKKRISTIIQ